MNLNRMTCSCGHLVGFGWHHWQKGKGGCEGCDCLLSVEEAILAGADGPAAITTEGVHRLARVSYVEGDGMLDPGIEGWGLRPLEPYDRRPME